MVGGTLMRLEGRKAILLACCFALSRSVPGLPRVSTAYSSGISQSQQLGLV